MWSDELIIFPYFLFKYLKSFELSLAVTQPFLINCEPFEEGRNHIYLASYDLSALKALAKMLCDHRCWQ